MVPGDEVGQLARGFNAMLDEIRRLVDDVLRAQIHEREAEFPVGLAPAAVCATDPRARGGVARVAEPDQPRFLYNALGSINMLALTHGDREISRMVTALGRLLRLTLSSTALLMLLRWAERMTHRRHGIWGYAAPAGDVECVRQWFSLLYQHGAGS